MVNTGEDQGFYWRTARDSLLTPAALTMFQIAARHVDESFDESKGKIDAEYEAVRGRGPSERHGGNFQTFIRVLEEAGWMYKQSAEPSDILRITEAGKQALELLTQVPDFLKSAPYFLIELLSRYQLNNPTGPKQTRNKGVADSISESDIFPYWTIYKIMRSCNNEISTEELRRFVFRLKSTSQIDDTISQIKAFRRDREAKLSDSELSKKYPPPVSGPKGEPKYIMARAGGQVGNRPPVIEKPSLSTYRLNPSYFSLIDKIISNEPTFREYIDEETWMKHYGAPVVLKEEFIPFSVTSQESSMSINSEEIAVEDDIWKQVNGILSSGDRNILFVGPPGTSKTWYALNIGVKLAENQAHRFHNIQFHQAFSYEDFVEGYVPSENEAAGFELKPKVFLRVCSAAYRDPSHIHVLVIDELNRGDPSRILGEALTYIERRDEFYNLLSGNSAIVPSNLVILATMNPFDKSIADIDQALDRRFKKILMEPQPALLKEILVTKNNMSEEAADRIIEFFNSLNQVAEGRIGHAYFNTVSDPRTLRVTWEHSLLPLLQKVLRFETSERIEGLKEQFYVLSRELESVENGSSNE